MLQELGRASNTNRLVSQGKLDVLACLDTFYHILNDGIGQRQGKRLGRTGRRVAGRALELEPEIGNSEGSHDVGEGIGYRFERNRNVVEAVVGVVRRRVMGREESRKAAALEEDEGQRPEWSAKKERRVEISGKTNSQKELRRVCW